MPDIRIERSTADKRNFAVLIDGDHVANFRHAGVRNARGYDLIACDGEMVQRSSRYTPTNQCDFQPTAHCQDC